MTSDDKTVLKTKKSLNIQMQILNKMCRHTSVERQKAWILDCDCFLFVFLFIYEKEKQIKYHGGV